MSEFVIIVSPALAKRLTRMFITDIPGFCPRDYENDFVTLEEWLNVKRDLRRALKQLEESENEN